MRIRQAVAATHPGNERDHNEDAVLRLARVPAFIVADGMGGPGGGDVAANLALTTVKDHSDGLIECNRLVAEERTTENRLALGRKLDELFNEAGRRISA